VSIVWCLVRALNGLDRDHSLWACLLLYALSFGHHLTTIALAPAVIWVLVTVEGSALWRPRTLGLIAAFAVVATVPYAYIYYLSHWGQGQELEYVGRDVTLSRLFHYVAGQQFKGRFFAFTWQQVLTNRTVESLTAIKDQLSFAGMALVLVGGIRALVRPMGHRFLPIVFLALAGQLFIALNYRVEAGLYLVPVSLLLTLVVAVGFTALKRWWIVAPLVIGLTVFHGYQSFATSRLRVPVTPLLTQARWQSAQAVGCRQLLAAPKDYFMSRLRNYLRFTGEYPVAEPYTLFREIKAIDGLCVDSTWKEKLGAAGGFQFVPQTESLEAFFARNREGTVLVALWVEVEPGTEVQQAFQSVGAAAAGLAAGGAYVGVVHRGRIVVEELKLDRPARLVLPKGKNFGSFVVRQPIRLVAAGKRFGRRTSIKLARHEIGSPRLSARFLVMDGEQNVVGDASTDTGDLDQFHLFYRVVSSQGPLQEAPLLRNDGANRVR
jgi:hypothetical protein